jgi:hypothetical protein
LADNPTPKYTVDQETRELLEAALNMVSQTATLQIDENSALSLVELCDEIADRFGIESDEVEVVDQSEPANDDKPTITVYRKARTKKPKLTVIDGDKLDDTPPDDDDQMH